jgi:glycosyltransferase involved in cell wall biosynthesis
MSVAQDSAYEGRHSIRPALAVITTAPAIDLVLPVHNEEEELARNVRRLHAYLVSEFPFSVRITIADSASNDRTWPLAVRLAEELSNVRLLHLNERGRGRAIAAAWLTSEARVVACMDIDPLTELTALLPTVAPVISGHSDVSVESRSTYHLSGYDHVLLWIGLSVHITDASCGFMATRSEIARLLVPRVHSRNRFFDAELLVLAERAGLRIHELPVASSSIYGGTTAPPLGDRFITS